MNALQRKANRSDIDQMLELKADMGDLDKNLREATGTNDLPETKYINNLDFYKDISAIGLLRDIGKHFRVT